jgi:hypothetical protein
MEGNSELSLSSKSNFKVLDNSKKNLDVLNYICILQVWKITMQNIF